MAQLIQFGEWLPDLPPRDNPGLIEAFNVFPDASSYRSVPNLVTFSSNALIARAQGAIIATDNNGNVYNFAGDRSALYALSADLYIDVTRAAGSGGNYTAPLSQGWEFAQFGNRLLAVNGYAGAAGSAGNVVQEMSLSVGLTVFHNLTGADFGAYTIAVVRDFVVIGNIFQATSASGVYAQRVRWCAINNPSSWTADPATLSDAQDLVGEGGPILRIIGGEYGIVLQRHSMWRMTFVGAPLVFQFDNIQRNIGVLSPKAAATYQNLLFFLSDDGFYVFDGSNAVPIGQGRVDNTFFEEVDPFTYNRINCVIHPEEKIVLWAYQSIGASPAHPDRILAYNWAFNRWSRINVTTELLTQHISAGGAVTLAGFGATAALARFDGSAMAATITTGELQIAQDRRAIVTEVRPIFQAGTSTSPTAQISIGVRDLFTTSASFNAAASPNATGFVPTRVSGRYHRFRLTTANNGSFAHLIGVEVEAHPEGIR